MPKETFYNIDNEKQERIKKVLKEEFEKKTFDQVSIKSIAEKLNIPRGSFYQYFESLEDAYFTVLARETSDIHYEFMKLLKKNSFDFTKALLEYGNFLSDNLFKKETYNLYKNWYLGFSENLEKKFREFKDKYKDYKDFGQMEDIDRDLILFVKAVVHNIIYRNFYEQWDRNKFVKVYMKNVEWITKGIEGRD
ncbi:MAG: TetR family transcriptional regulator [Peptoniphilaceae bacterium]|nr:TetR family transcriptional regulator [Peptoniphilaceae bacterium]MDY6018528.1 TetR family transcriptional regulator [Anaerococcus sp.]